MNRKRLLLLIALLAACAGLFYFYAGHTTPPGQPALSSLTPETFTTLASAFNAAKDEARVILLLSPT